MAHYDDGAEFSSMVGRTIAAIEKSDDEITFTMENGDRYKMYHRQDCCESVSIEDIVGDIGGLIGSPLLVAEVVTDGGSPKSETYGESTWTDESSTWTFYKLANINGHVDIRWYGSSNGYYSEDVDFVKLND